MKGYIKLRRHLLHILQTEIPDHYSYHGMSHTMNVLKVCNQYIRREKVTSEEAKLLRIGALCHDIGFIVSNQNHEEESIVLAASLMTHYGFSDAHISIVKGLIQATRVPQNPKTSLEKLLCDADLDYLGRDDYYEISNKLYQELKTFKLISNKEEWKQQQINFLKAHRYHTQFARKNRQPAKENRIKELSNRPN